LQQPDGVPGGRGVDDDVVVLPGQRRVGEQRGELVESGDWCFSLGANRRRRRAELLGSTPMLPNLLDR